MSVVLTGDVHQWIPSADRRFTDASEAALALDYARIAGEHGLKVTLFLTGRAILENRTEAQPLVELENVEIGGHGWDSFQPIWRYRPIHRVYGTLHGPAGMQERMVCRTCAVLERFAGKPVRSWRNHAYQRNRDTPGALRRAGLTAWSDEVDPLRTHPYRHESGIVILPINTTPDHENVYHGDQTVTSVPPAERPRHLHPREWCELVCAQVDRIVGAGGVATILAHPLCMKVADDWRTFERLCAALSRYGTSFASEAVQPLLVST